MKYSILALVACLALSHAFNFDFQFHKSPNAPDTVTAEAIGQQPNHAQRPSLPSRPVPPTYQRPMPIPEEIVSEEDQLIDEVQRPSLPQFPSIHRPAPLAPEEIVVEEVEEEVQRPSRPHFPSVHRPGPHPDATSVPPPPSSNEPGNNRPSIGAAIFDFFRPHEDNEAPHITSEPRPTPEVVVNEESRPHGPPHHNFNNGHGQGGIVQPIAPVETTVVVDIVPTPKYPNRPNFPSRH